MNKKKISRELLIWYQQHIRDLPWRKTKDPYRIWISEVMLQQTRVETVIPYYQKWIAAFPDLSILNNTSEEEVLRMWEGLGYYRRAINILKTAEILITEHEGKFPDSVKELKKLPGIGDYIAGALASIAFGKNEIALDGNGLRVLSRLIEFKFPVNEPASKNALKTFMRELLPAGSASQFNQAIMDLGSLICRPKKPRCEQCPLSSECSAYRHNSQEIFPLRKKKKALPHYDVVAAVIQMGEMVLIDKRREKGLLGGLWEFPGGKVEAGETRHAALKREILEELGVEISITNDFGEYNHAYTHYKITVYVFKVKIIKGEPAALEADEIQWAAINDLNQYPMGKVDRLISLSLAK